MEGRSLDEHVEENGMSIGMSNDDQKIFVAVERVLEVMLVKAVMDRVFRRSFRWQDGESGDVLDELGE